MHEAMGGDGQRFTAAGACGGHSGASGPGTGAGLDGRPGCVVSLRTRRCPGVVPAGPA